MALLLVTYEHKSAGRDYTPFFEAIKTNANGWWHYLESVWIVNTDLSADAFAKKLFPHMTKSDRLLVVRVTREHQGWLTEDAWNWLNAASYD